MIAAFTWSAILVYICWMESVSGDIFHQRSNMTLSLSDYYCGTSFSSIIEFYIQAIITIVK